MPYLDDYPDEPMDAAGRRWVERQVARIQTKLGQMAEATRQAEDLTAKLAGDTRPARATNERMREAGDFPSDAAGAMRDLTALMRQIREEVGDISDNITRYSNELVGLKAEIDHRYPGAWSPDVALGINDAFAARSYLYLASGAYQSELSAAIDLIRDFTQGVVHWQQSNGHDQHVAEDSGVDESGFGWLPRSVENDYFDDLSFRLGRVVPDSRDRVGGFYLGSDSSSE